MKTLIIDTDAGIDDAQALMMALAYPDAKVAAITMVSGNVHLDKVTRNVARVLDLCDANVPFYRGADGPLVGTHRDAATVHGTDGLGDADLPHSERQPAAEHAVHALLRMVDEAPGQYTLVTLGPLTNIALATRLDPTFPSKLHEVIVMGGTIAAHGNVTWTAEYNVYADPEAMHIVFDTFPLISMVSWETTVHHQMPWEWYEGWVKTSTPKGRFMQAITRNYAAFARNEFHAAGYFLPDPLATAVALQPDIVRDSEQHYATVELSGAHTRGQVVIDYNDFSGKPPNLNIVTRIDMADFRQLLEAAVL